MGNKSKIKIKELETHSYYNINDIPFNTIFKIGDDGTYKDRYMLIPPLGGGRILIIFSETEGMGVIIDSIALSNYFSNCKVFVPCACTICINGV